MAETPQVERDEKGRIRGGVLNPHGASPKEVRELHALVRSGIPRAFERALEFLESEDPMVAKVGMDWIGKYGLPVPQMKSADKTANGEPLGLDADRLKALLAALRAH